MRLSTLEMHGFKSFADSTTLTFDAGVTAVVGPNGCGKSNIADAVRWVLGEQRARALRGAKMDEVIFQGSSARRPVSVAEVSLHFVNDDGKLPVAYQEVVVTRRLSRSGESDYLLNGASCRLRDIHDLLRGTGLGADAGVVIESRMVDTLLSDRPDERRDLFEEAAGVGLYRDRRRTTERRLEETAVDLSRLDDLLGEVQTQVRSLARQRRRAERHTELRAKYRAVDVTLAARELTAAHTELHALDAALSAVSERIPHAESAAREAEGRRVAAHAERSSAESRRTECARLSATQQQGLANLRGEIGVAEERQRNALARRQHAEDERRQGESQGGRVHAECEIAAADRVRLEEEVRLAVATQQEALLRYDSARQGVAGARSRLDATEAGLQTMRDTTTRLDLDRGTATREADEIHQRLATLESTRTRLAAELAAAQNAVTAARAQLATAMAAAEAATAAATREDAARHTAQAEESKTRQQLAHAEDAVTSLDMKLAALEALERDRVGLAPGAAELLRARKRFGDGAVLGPISDFLSAAPDDATVVERFLGPSVHAVLVRDRGAADAIRAWHAEANPGPLLLLPLDAVDAHDGTQAAEAGTLATRVAPETRADAWIRILLGRARDLDSGSAFEDARGAIWLPGPTAGAGPVRRRAELTTIRAARNTAQMARRSVAQRAATAQAEREATERTALRAGEEAESAARAARGAADRLADAEHTQARAERDAHEANEMVSRLTARAAGLAMELAQINADVAQATDAAAEREAAFDAARTTVAAAEREQDAARDAYAASQVALAQHEARLQIAAERERRLTEEHASATGRLASLRSELETLAATDGALGEQLTSWRVDLASRQAALVDTEAQLAGAESAVRDADEALQDAERALDVARQEIAALGDEQHRVGLHRVELAGRDRAIRERLEIEWREAWDTLVAANPPSDIDSEVLRQDAATLREELAALGPVNPLAIEEHSEELKRFEFLTAQRADLAAARASLEQAIREIDTTARALFLTTFEQVRTHFRQIFLTLFGGGECDLRLANPEAPLDCDIEIHASPRGKRTQRIHLLSTGERALVALSLLFGIFLTKPSPFCLLDEVDAPLDDQNIGRFVHMLQTFKAKTQFIVITHNPRTTTEAADAVYGVTMQEPGVSSFVSVRLTPSSMAA